MQLFSTRIFAWTMFFRHIFALSNLIKRETNETPKLNIKQFALLLGLLLAALWCGANDNRMMAGYSTILIKEANVQSTPKGNTIQASIDGHWLTVTYTQDIGTVTMELDKVNGPNIFGFQTVTPESFGFYLNQTGDYILTFTLSNGDEYYGEFTVTN